jgi:hypothetical protein
MLLTACSGGTAAEVVLDEPPWGLDQIDMPDSEETVAEVVAAMPDEIAGLSRSGGGPNGVMYEPTSPGLPWLVQAQPNEQIEMFGMPGIRTAEDWLRYIGSDQMLGASEWERALTGDLLWVANDGPMEVGPGEMGRVYMLNWAEAGGTWAFSIQTTSKEGRVALVDAFITAAGS